MQGLFARVGSGDPVRVLRLFHNNYTGYCCIHLLCITTYNLSLPRLSANYYGLPTTVQLRAAHKNRCSRVGVSRSTASGTVLYLPRTVSLWDRSTSQPQPGEDIQPQCLNLPTSNFNLQTSTSKPQCPNLNHPNLNNPNLNLSTSTR